MEKGNLAIRLLEVFLTHDLILPIYKEPEKLSAVTIFDLAEIATRQEERLLKQSLGSETKPKTEDSKEDAEISQTVKDKWSDVKEMISKEEDGTFPIFTDRLTVRFVKVVSETVTKRVKKQGVEHIKKSKSVLILTFEGANVLLG
jgi:hypothetical protein